MLIGLAEAARQRWLPFGTVDSYSLRDLFGEPLLGLYAALWALLGVLTGGQVMAADRAAGVDVFLLDRPLPRGLIWLARVAAGVGLLLLFVAVHGACFGTLSWRLAEMGALASPLHFGALALPLLGFVAGMAGASLTRTPMQAALVGPVVIAGPLIAGALVLRVFPHLQIGLPLGLVLAPLIAIAGLTMASYVAECRGEPSGRGRARRSVVWLVAATLLIPMLFVVAAPLSLRTAGWREGWVVFSPSGTSAVTTGRWSGLWLQGPGGDRRRFVPPPIVDFAWDATGERLAVLGQGTTYGADREDPVLHLFDADGRRLAEPAPCPLSGAVSIEWVGDEVWVPIGPQTEVFGMHVVDASNGEARRVGLDIDRMRRRWAGLLDAHGRPVLVSEKLVRPDPEQEDRRLYEVRTIEEGEVVVSGDLTTSMFYTLTLGPPYPRPIRYWPVDDRGGKTFLDQLTGERYLIPDAKSTLVENVAGIAYMAEDRTLRVGPPGEATPRRRFGTHAWIPLTASPDGRRLSARVYGDGGMREAWIYDVEPDSWIDIVATYPELFDGDDRRPTRVSFVGNDEVGIATTDWAVSVDLTTGERRVWRGRPPMP